jgi:Na+-driven multidrug efflux pump
LRLLASGLVIFYADVLLGTSLLSSDRQGAMSLVSLSAIPVNIVLNLVLIPYTQIRWSNSGIGSAAATILTEVYIMIIFCFLMPPGFFRRFSPGLILKSAAAGAVMIGSFLLMRYIGLYWIVQAPLSLGIYISGLFLMKAFRRSEVDVLRECIISVRQKIFVTIAHGQPEQKKDY